MSQPLLEINDLCVYYPKYRGLLNRLDYHIKAVNGVSLTIHQGETLGLVGESGCGKSTIGRAVVGLAPVTRGSITIGETGHSPTRRDIARQVQLIFQDPYGSLNPKRPVGEAVEEGVLVAEPELRGERLTELAREALGRVGIEARALNRYPHEFSGGQRQRICIARAIAARPRLIICDEAVSALDVSVQASILNLLADLQRNQGLAYLFISHDLSVVRTIAHRIAVMYLGELVETGTAQEVFETPLHPYSASLISAIPDPDPAASGERIILPGDVPSPVSLPEGCYFAARCPFAIDVCKRRPDLRPCRGGSVRCHRVNTEKAVRDYPLADALRSTGRSS